MAVFADSLEARCQVENEDVVGAAPTGDAPTTSEWSTILLPTKVHLILEILRYIPMFYVDVIINSCPNLDADLSNFLSVKERIKWT